MKILKILSKKFIFSSIENFSSRKLFPKYTGYSDYKSYITEIMNDGHVRDIMSIGYPIALTNTSGTSGDPKNFPVYGLNPFLTAIIFLFIVIHLI